MGTSKETSITNLNVVEVSSPESIKQIIRKGSRIRATSSTLMNARSSRSHCIVTFEIESTPKKEFEEKIGSKLNAMKTRLHLVDLAGSECISQSGAKGITAVEASFVNKSLAALGDVMQSLAKRSKHVPYRNSLLTQVLQSSLGGDAKFLLIVILYSKRF